MTLRTALRDTRLGEAWRALKRFRQPDTNRLHAEIVRRAAALPDARSFAWQKKRPGLFLRADFWNRACRAGGSIAHAIHLLNALRNAGQPMRVLSGVPLPGFGESSPDVAWLPGPPRRWRAMPFEAQLLGANRFLRRTIAQPTRGAGFLYERPALGNLLGAECAAHAGIPYVLEYNGSDVWICRHWGEAPLEAEDLFQQVEDGLLRAAHLVVAVSDALGDSLRKKGVPEERILVNPNGVDADVFDPETFRSDRPMLREKTLGFPADAIVLGFIGTFGAWHGVEVISRAMPDLFRLDDRIRLLLIGTGVRHAEVAGKVRALGAEDRVCLTEAIAQPDAPRYLSACDIFLSPHALPPGDPGPFFGSPTKLFEYMAMARPVIASDLGQIGTVVHPALRADAIADAPPDTPAVGVLTPPGDADKLLAAAKALLSRPDLWGRLGQNARQHALGQYTWQRHAHRILDRLDALSSA